MIVTHNEETVRLKCCPFCGSECVVNFQNVDGSGFVECIECGSRTRTSTDNERVVQDWNKRAYEVDEYIIKDGLTRGRLLIQILESAIDAPVVRVGDRPE